MNTKIAIDGLKLVRLDRTERKGGGCVLYYKEHLKAVHRKDLSVPGIEAIWLQVKFPSCLALFSVMYRPPDRYDFFDKIYDPLEKAWTKSSNIFLLGDFNCNFSQNANTESGLEACGNTKKLLNIFQMFDLNNVINEMTRITLTSESLIDLIVTTRMDMVQSSGVFPFGISDHNLVYATLRLKVKRPPPVIIRCRNFKLMNDTNFKRDVSRAPFHIGEIFDDPNDKLWTWEKLFKEICDIHAPWKEVKIRSKSLPWMNNTIRLKQEI